MWEALDKAIQVDGWKLILLLRVSPLVPYNVMNVLLGSSGIHFSTFVFFSTIGESSCTIQPSRASAAAAPVPAASVLRCASAAGMTPFPPVPITPGIIPECMITVYFGTLAGNVANVINGRAGPQGAAKLGLVAVGGGMMVLAALYAAFVTR